MKKFKRNFGFYFIAISLMIGYAFLFVFCLANIIISFLMPPHHIFIGLLYLIGFISLIAVPAAIYDDEEK